jgi:hypothetical protein
MKAPREEGGGRILLAVVLRPIKFQCALIWISADFLAYTYIYSKGKVKFTLEQAKKVHRDSKGIALFFLQPRR